MGHLWTLDVFLILRRCHACGCWGNSILQSRILMESQSNFIASMHVKWRYMLVSKNRYQMLLFKATSSHVETPRSYRTVTRCRFLIVHNKKPPTRF